MSSKMEWCEHGQIGEECMDCLRQDCLQEMTTVFKRFEQQISKNDGDTELFGIQVMEQWRPWL